MVIKGYTNGYHEKWRGYHGILYCRFTDGPKKALILLKKRGLYATIDIETEALTVS